MASFAEILYGKGGTPPPPAPRNRFAEQPRPTIFDTNPMNGQAPLANLSPHSFLPSGNNNTGGSFQLFHRADIPNVPKWTPPQLDANGHFTSQQDIDDFKAVIGNSGYSINPSGSLSAPAPDVLAVTNNKLAREWGHANGFWNDPPGGHGGIRGAVDFIGEGLKNIVLTPPVLAALTAGAGAYFGAGAGAGGSALGAGETGAFDAATGLYDVASAPSTMAALSAAEYPGAVGAVAGAGAGTAVATAPGGGGNAAFGGGNQSAASVGGGSSGATTMQLVKDYGGLALTLGGLLSAGGSAPDIPNAPPAPEGAPASQAARQPDEIARRRNASTGSTDNTLLTGSSGIDPFTLNLGRSKLLGQ